MQPTDDHYQRYAESLGEPVTDDLKAFVDGLDIPYTSAPLPETLVHFALFSHVMQQEPVVMSLPPEENIPNTWETAANPGETTSSHRSVPARTQPPGDRFMIMPSRVTAFLAIIVTACLIAASIGIFVALNHHSQPPAISTITPSPTPQGPFAMPANIYKLTMVSDHEGWALVNVTAGQNLLHFSKGIWQPVLLPGLTPPYYGFFAMASASDGWFLTSSRTGAYLVFHYDGLAWEQVALPPLHGKGTPQLDTIKVGANGDAWIVGNYLNPPGNLHSEQQMTPYGALGCVPPCNYLPLVLHFVDGRWMEVTVPAGVNIQPDSVSVGWFAGNTTKPTLYHYQGGSWSQLPIDIPPNYHTELSMITPTDGWIQVQITDASPSYTYGDSILYHFNGTTIQRIADLSLPHCQNPTGGLGTISTTPPDDAWVPTISGCTNTPAFWHLHGDTATVVDVPAPYNDNTTWPVQSDGAGNIWLLVLQINLATPTVPNQLDLTHEAILRWNGSRWVIFAQTVG